VSVSENDPVIACFRVELHVPLRAEREAHASIHAGFVDAIRGENVLHRHRGLKESKERIEACKRGDIRRSELLAPVIETAAADKL